MKFLIPNNTFNIQHLTFNIFVLLLLFLPTSCGVYSFTGINLDPRIKTVAITNFYNNSGGGPANLSQTFTERMKDYYQNNSPLKIANQDGDLLLEGSIVGYDLIPVAPTADQQASLNRLTIRVQVKFTNTVDETKNFDSQFSFYSDFPQTETLSSAEGRLIDIIFEQIIYDVFNKSVADW